MGRNYGKSAANSARSSSATGRTSSFVDVTGRPYVEVDTFVPKYDEIGVMPPLGRWDPLQIREQGPERYRRFVEMEIKHGRMSMAAVTGVLVTYSGLRWPGYLSTAEGIRFSDIPDDWLWARYPDGYDVWLGDGSTKQVGEEELFLGKTWKLNAERNNGRGAMMGITGMIIHESLTGNPVFPIGEQL